MTGSHAISRGSSFMRRSQNQALRGNKRSNSHNRRHNCPELGTRQGNKRQTRTNYIPALSVDSKSDSTKNANELLLQSFLPPGEQRKPPPILTVGLIHI